MKRLGHHYLAVFLFAIMTIVFSLFWYCTPPNDDVFLTILNSTDMHGDFERKKTMGNISDVVQCIKKYKSIDSERVIAIDCGDFSVGSPESVLTKGEVVYDYMAAAGYDVIVPGNHEFDYGIDSFLYYVQRLKGVYVLSANLKIENDTRLQSWALLQRGGKKIAIIGVMTPNFNASSQLFFTDSRFTFNPKISQSIAEIMPEILDRKPDYIILAMHAGEYTHYKEFRKILSQYPQINLVVGGHSHQLVKGKKVGNKAWFTQSGIRCNALIENKIYLSRKHDPICETRFIPFEKMGLKDSVNTSMQALLDKRLCDFSDFKWEKSGMINLKNELNLRMVIDSSIKNQYAIDAYWLCVRHIKPIQAKSFSYRNLYQLFPYTSELVYHEVTISQLEELCKLLTRRKKTRSLLDDFWGIKYVQRGKGKGAEFDFYDQKGGRLEKNRKIRLMMSLYQLQGGGHYEPRISEILIGRRFNIHVIKEDLVTLLEKYLKQDRF